MSLASSSTFVPIFETDYPFKKTNDVAVELVRDLLIKFYLGIGDEMDRKVDAAFRELFSKPIKKRKISSIYLHGIPGHGKTSVIHGAAKMVAKILGMNLLDGIPYPGYRPSKNDLIINTKELSGEVSAMSFGGIPNKATYLGHDGKEVSYMEKIVEETIIAMSHAGGAILLLDDLDNASASIKNVALSLIERGAYQGIHLGHRTYVTATGNLGSLDYTNTSRTSSALDTRCKNYYVEDNIDDWVNRVIAEDVEREGDVGLIGFLKSKPELFAMEPIRGPFGSPRTWSKTLEELRSFDYTWGESGLHSSVFNLQATISSIVGKTAGSEFASYYLALKTGAWPIAAALIEKGEFNREAFEHRYQGGHSTDNQDFAYQFSTALGDHYFLRIEDFKSDVFVEATHNMARGLLSVNEHSRSTMWSYLKIKMDASPSMKDTTGGNSEFERKKAIIKTMSQVPNMFREVVQNASNVLSGFENYKEYGE